MLHNFGHSFVSLNNYVDNDYVADALPQLARQSPNYELKINFSNGEITPPDNYPERLHKSISYWMDWLPKHIENHGLESERLSDIYFRYRLVKAGTEIIVSCTDDRGVEHKVFVHK